MTMCEHGVTGKCEHVEEIGTRLENFFFIECPMCRTKISLATYNLMKKRWYVIDGGDVICGYCVSRINKKFSE